jgi:glycosyltransferase involved in cell wall biosynthesis
VNERISTNPLLTIVIPVYNEEKNVSFVIEDIIQAINQDQDNVTYEIILVNDGSQDDTGNVIKKISQQNYHVMAVDHAVNQGLGGALKTGFAHATGQYITWISGDGEIRFKQVFNVFRGIKKEDIIIINRCRSVPLYRDILTFAMRLLSQVILGFDPTPYLGIFIIRGDLLKSFNIVSNSGMVSIEIARKCYNRGCLIKYDTYEVTPRLSGKSKVTNIPTILKNIRDMVRLRIILRRDRKTN